MNVVRWGLLSTANINQAIIPAIRASSRGKLLAVASRSLENAQQYAKKRKIKQARVLNSYCFKKPANK